MFLNERWFVLHQVFPVTEAVVGQSDHSSIRQIDFSLQPLFKDPDPFDNSILVIGSDGQRGSLSRLDTSVDPGEYASALLKHWREPVPVVVAGGNSGSSESINLVQDVILRLEEAGFQIVDRDVGGLWERQATITAHQVRITRIDNIANTRTPIFLSFGHPENY